MNLSRVYQMNGKWYAVWHGRQHKKPFDSKAAAVFYLFRCKAAGGLVDED